MNTILKAISQKASQKFNTVREALRHLDADCDGKVTNSDLRYFFRAYDFPAHVADRFFQYLLPDADGYLDYYAIVDYVTPLFHSVGAGVSFDVEDKIASEIDEHPEIEEARKANIQKEFKSTLAIIGTKAAEKFRNLRDVFRFVDTDHNGTIDRGEMQSFFRAFNLPAEAANRFHDALEDKSTGEVDYNEFVSHLGPYVQSSFAKTDLPLRRAAKPSPKKAEEKPPLEEEVISPSGRKRGPRIDPQLQVELQKLMQDIGHKLDLKFKHIRDAFKMLDLDRTGTINRGELRSFFRGFGYGEDVADKVYDLIDQGGRGEIDYETFMSHFDLVVGKQFRCTKRAPLISMEDRQLEKEVNEIAKMMQERLTTKYNSVADAFRAVDLNKDGTVSASEMQKFVQSFGKDPSAAGKIFKALDADNSGSVQYDEFVALFGMEEQTRTEPPRTVHLPRLQGCVLDQAPRRRSR